MFLDFQMVTFTETNLGQFLSVFFCTVKAEHMFARNLQQIPDASFTLQIHNDINVPHV